MPNCDVRQISIEGKLLLGCGCHSQAESALLVTSESLDGVECEPTTTLNHSNDYSTREVEERTGNDHSKGGNLNTEVQMVLGHPMATELLCGLRMYA